MPETMAKFLKRMDKEEQLRKQGIETRKPVDHCSDCGRPMHENPISADEQPDADFNPLSDHKR